MRICTSATWQSVCAVVSMAKQTLPSTKYLIWKKAKPPARHSLPLPAASFYHRPPCQEGAHREEYLHSPAFRYLHDVYEIAECPFRTPIPILNVGDRIGKEYVEIDAHKIVGVVECNIPEEARAFKPLDPVTEQMGHNVADFLVSDLKKGHIPPPPVPAFAERSGRNFQCRS